MPRQGLDRAAVVRAAADLIEEKGMACFSLGGLARKLHIRPSSLYNHVEGLEDLLKAVALLAVDDLVRAEQAAVRDKTGREALLALAVAYRDYARTHPELYRAVMHIHRWDSAELEVYAGRIVRPIADVLAAAGLNEAERHHGERALRAVMHGFVAHEQAGAFSHFPEDRDESYRLAVQYVVDGLCRTGREPHEDERTDPV